MPTRFSLAALLGLLLAGSSAFAAGSTALPGMPEQEPSLEREIPARCRPFLQVPADARDDTMGWNQALSFAACLQDDAVARVDRPEQLAPLVDELSRRLAPAMVIYVYALQHGPGPIQVRAAYQIAMAHVALITRARASLADPALDARLEPLLARAKRIAGLSFAVLDRAVAENPALAPDPVTREMVRSARETMAAFPAPAGAVELR